jgi:hypothetical protein
MSSTTSHCQQVPDGVSIAARASAHSLQNPLTIVATEGAASLLLLTVVVIAV